MCKKPINLKVSAVYVVSINNMAIACYSNLLAAYNHFSIIVKASSSECLSYSAVGRQIKADNMHGVFTANKIQYSIKRFSLLKSFTSNLFPKSSSYD